MGGITADIGPSADRCLLSLLDQAVAEKMYECLQVGSAKVLMRCRNSSFARSSGRS